MCARADEAVALVDWSAGFDDLVVGQRFCSEAHTVSEAEVIAFCALTGDCHPLHYDPVWAATSVFGERIAHGLLVVSLAVGLVPVDPARVLAMRRLSDVVFKRPVRFGDVIAVTGTLVGCCPVNEQAGLVDLRWAIRNQDSALVCRADVQVLWSRGSASLDTAAGVGDRAWRE
jgi:3-hydroxybutyryl-CoA dehydratase